MAGTLTLSSILPVIMPLSSTISQYATNALRRNRRASGSSLVLFSGSIGGDPPTLTFTGLAPSTGLLLIPSMSWSVSSAFTLRTTSTPKSNAHMNTKRST
ncbi:hypothetical protein EDB19DRAFT_1695665 [Suillus lakei]|nr:hypothetical protein EDB19DRAFT_1695665 [Suillus lakei]